MSLIRIASLAPSSTEIVYALGAGDELVCATSYCDYPEDARHKTKIGGWLNPDLKKLRELQPDVVLTSNFLQNNLVKLLRAQGFNVVHVDPRTLEQVLESFVAVGESIGRTEEGRRLVERISSELEGIRQTTRDTRHKTKVYVEEWNEPPTVSGNWVPDIVKTAGGVSLIESGVVSRPVTLEEVVDFEPDVMIVSWCGFGEDVALDEIQRRTGWEGVKAVRNKNVHVFDDALLNRPGPRLVEAAKKIYDLCSAATQ